MYCRIYEYKCPTTSSPCIRSNPESVHGALLLLLVAVFLSPATRAAASDESWSVNLRGHRHHHRHQYHHRTASPSLLHGPPPPPPPPPVAGEEIDPRYGVQKRLVPTGPNPLHN